MPKVVRPLIIAATLSLSLSNAGFAAGEGPKTIKSLSSTSVTPSIGAFVFWGDTHLDPAPVYGVKVSRDNIGVNVADSFGIEGTFNYFTTNATNGEKESANGYVFRLDGIYDIPLAKKKYMPFLAVGLGDILIDRGTSSQNSFLFNYGVGVKYRLEEWLTLRADLRHLLVYKNVNTSDVVELSAGLTYHFGKDHTKKPATENVAPVPEITEPVPEAKPMAAIDPSLLAKLGIEGPAVVGIPMTPPPYQAATAPPPPPFANIPAKPQEAPPAEQPAAPAPVPPQAPAPGAPAETKQVQPAPPQAQPEEPKQVIEKEAPPAAVKPQPAPEQPALPRIIYQVTVEFDFDSSQLRPMYHNELKNLAAKIAIPNTSVRIEGHTDIIGRAGYNDRLSARRAKAVKDFLIKCGVPAKKISTKGFGFYKPAAENATETGRQKNRRATALAIVIQATADPAQEDKAASGAPQRGEKPASSKRNVRSKTNNKTTVRRPK